MKHCLRIDMGVLISYSSRHALLISQLFSPIVRRGLDLVTRYIIFIIRIK